MRKSLFLFAALPLFGAGAAQAADLTLVNHGPAARAVTVTRADLACPAIPVMVARGRRGMGEPGTFYAYWGWRTPYSCNMVFGR